MVTFLNQVKIILVLCKVGVKGTVPSKFRRILIVTVFVVNIALGIGQTGKLVEFCGISPVCLRRHIFRCCRVGFKIRRQFCIACFRITLDLVGFVNCFEFLVCVIRFLDVIPVIGDCLGKLAGIGIFSFTLNQSQVNPTLDPGIRIRIDLRTAVRQCINEGTIRSFKADAAVF